MCQKSGRKSIWCYTKWLLVLCDFFTKWTKAYAIPDQESLTIALTILNEFICMFGSLLQLHSDQGRSFEANLFQDLCDLLKIDKTRSTSQHPNQINIFLSVEAVIPRPHGPDESTTPETDKYINELQDAISKSHVLARKHLKQNSEYQKRHYDFKAVKRELQIGQAVWFYDASKRKGICHKLTSKWKGPHVVTRKIHDITYLVKRSKKQPGKVYHT
ncbi:unnamed protein product [Mytilus coruscus]|uniref:Integrase catalytic domain-containing protein n=1 Tax=Mytilus coruscus TaxID=42192 RepID=A0A6J8B9M5_MYTCO|nr:unnamed protein product [Mytilus coruscus]